MCPRPRDGFIGTCVNRCDPEAEDACPVGQECCPGGNGCAYGCVEPVTTCMTHIGEELQPGETFPAGDGCNTW